MEKLLLVNQEDKVIGTRSKQECHQGGGLMHRAFSVYIFNSKGELLIQQRSKDKPLWPWYWSNSCCSHPVSGESYIEAGEERLKEELGFTCPLRSVDQFHYRAKYKDVGSENELVTLLIGVYDGEVEPNPEEVKEYKWMGLEELEKDIRENPGQYSPWFRKGLKRYLRIKKKKDQKKKELMKLLQTIAAKADPLMENLLETHIEKKFYDLVTHQVATGGKRLRPALTMIAGKMMGGREKDLLHPAVGTEILHNSTLITDDIIDHSEVRRGKPTVWKQFGRSVAECAGVHYTATVYLTASNSPDPKRVTDIFTKALKTVVDGEIYDILFEQKGREDEPYIYKNRYRNVSLQSYYKMVGKKTASLLESCCELGGVCAGAPEKDLKNLKKYGYNLGIAFQIQDDILDIFGDQKEFGKKIGKDIEERKLGNVVIFYAIQSLSKTKKDKILKILRKKDISDRDIQEAIELIKQTSARRKAFHLGEKYAQKAKESLEKLPQNKWNQYLHTLADFTIERKK
ncbi:MAG TPA: isopentenyl-diphosphate Delta-isomerase [Patescibacteria group bacterium]|nr:isopentenyl-diphosphate Delta-isomerase [Patescibacteria group bacterium]